MRKRRTAPRLPSALQTDLHRLNPRISSNSDDEIDSGVGNDVYEYEEEVPQEEFRKNRHPVKNYEYEFPQDFEYFLFLMWDENVSSDNVVETRGHKMKMLMGVMGLKRKMMKGT